MSAMKKENYSNVESDNHIMVKFMYWTNGPQSVNLRAGTQAVGANVDLLG